MEIYPIAQPSVGIGDRSCKECGKEYKPNRYWQKYCSRECYKAAQRKEMQDLRALRLERKAGHIEDA